jgi:hypothetical protein
MMRAGAVREAHSSPLVAVGRRPDIRRPWREAGRPGASRAGGGDSFAWYPGECVLGLPGGGRERAPVGGQP